MIYLETGDNKVVFTLYENCQNVVNPYFTFKIIDKDRENSIIFTATADNSPHPYYWNAFTFSVGTQSGGLTAGYLNVPQPSQFVYEVYEMTTPYDLDLNNAIGLVESGLITIGGTWSQISTFTASGTPISVWGNLNRI
jgi:hypothetical protein